MPTSAPDYITNDPVETYVPVPFPSTYPRNAGGQPTGNTSGGTTQGDTVYAAALFFNATCKKTDKVGNWVRADSAPASVTTTTSGLSYPALGIIVTKGSDTTCVVQTYGLCGGIYSGLTPNVRLFVGPTGQASAASQLPSGTAYLQSIGFVVRSDTIFVQPSGTLFRRDAAADPADPAPPPSGDSLSTYRAVLHGEGAPDAGIGQVGDVYLATDSLLLFARGADGWDQGKPFGSATAGQPGADGAPGSRIYRVASLPADGTGYAAGDLLIDDQGNLAQVANSSGG